MEIRLFRDPPLQRETRSLPAALYNQAHALLGRADNGLVFVPIRPMQFMAIIDREEIVFVDGMYRDEVVIAWHRFQPAARAGLDAPVPFELCLYLPESAALLPRLFAEFPKAMALLASRDRPTQAAKVLKFERRS